MSSAAHWMRRPHEKLPKSTLAEAEQALAQSRREQSLVRQMRTRVNQVTADTARQLETNHLAELFRPAFRGDGA